VTTFSNSECVEYVGLRSKCYALKIKNVLSDKYDFKKTAKGLGNMAIKNRLKMKKYKKWLFNQKYVRHYYTGIDSQNHYFYSVVQNKKALSCFNSKRYILTCGFHSDPINSVLIKRFKGKCKCTKAKIY